MAGDWLKWTKGLAKRREVVFLAGRFKRDRREIAGRLMELWEWCDDNFDDLDVDALSLNVSLSLGDKPFEFVDAILGLPGMAEAMTSPEVRWLQATPGGRVMFPKLARHNGSSAKARASEQRKKADQRRRKEIESRSCPDNTGTASGPEIEREIEEENTFAASPPLVKPRSRDPLWDAIVEVTGVDPSIRTKAAHVGRVKKALTEATPPYDASDVLKLPALLAAQMPWAAGRIITLGEVEKHIDLTRNTALPIPAPPSRGPQAKTRAESILDHLANAKGGANV